MSLLQHLEELRNRLVRALGAIVLVFALLWLRVDWLVNLLAPRLGSSLRLAPGTTGVDLVLEFLASPIYRLLPEGRKLAFLGLTDPFVLYIKAALLAALFIASPVVLYQLWRFAAPGLYSHERRFVLPVVTSATLFFLGGGAFAYFVAFPFATRVLLDLGAAFEPMLTVERYFRFLLTIVVGLGVMFELPVAIFLLAWAGVVTPGFLWRNFRWAVLVIFAAAAIITPTPDVVNLCLFAVPTLGLYLLGTGAAWLVWRKKGDEER